MRNSEKLLAQKPLVDQYLSLKPHMLSPYHFSSIFLWQDFFEFEFEVFNDSLCIYAHQKGASFLYLPPLAQEIKPEVIAHCLEKMNKVNPRTARFENIEEDDLKHFTAGFRSYAKSQDYIYKKEDLILLKGSAYKSQRHDIHHFLAREPSLLRPFEPQDYNECLALYDRWARNRHDKYEDEVYRQMLEENRIVHELALNFSKQLGLVGYVVEINKKIKAYSLGYSLNRNIFCVLLEITSTDVIGLSAYIFNRFCASEELREHTLINTMDDFGMPFVAASKQAYHPTLKPVSYTVTQTQ